MTKRKLKGYVLPTCFIILSIIVASIFVVTKNMQKEEEETTDYVLNSVTEEEVPVVKETPSATYLAPYIGDNVKITNNFYNINGTEEEQQNSLLYYENTYIKNNGVVYSSEQEFDCIAAADGTVLEVKEDEILNNVVYLKHSDNTTTIYYGLKDVNLKVNDEIKQGDIIGKSTSNKFSLDKNSILFEVQKEGKGINPEELLNNQN